MIKIINNSEEHDSSESLFKNLPELLRPDVVADLLGISVKTIYDWRYKRKTRNLPEGLFIKINRFLYIRTVELKRLIVTQNHSLT